MPSEMRPWIQVIALEWRPDLGFFESRSALLRELEGRDLFEQFHWDVDDVTVRIGEFGALTIGAKGAAAYVASPKAELERVREALVVALNNLHPRDVVFTQARFRQLVPLALNPIEAQHRSAAKLMGHTWSEAEPTDYALLVDGISQRVGGTFQVEFGVVQQKEVTFRFQRPESRVGHLAVPIAPDLKDIPESAMLLDWHWLNRVPMDLHNAKSVVTRWDDLLDESRRLALQIRDYCLSGMREDCEERA